MERVVIVSGFAGSGKSTLAKKIAKEFGLKYVSASAILKELRKKSIEEIRKEKLESEKDWWESSEGMNYVKQRAKDLSFDKKLDEELLKIIEKGNVVLDSKTMGYLSKKGFKVWLKASAENRAERVSGRDGLSKKEVLKKLKERDETDKKIYKKLYGFELGKNLEVFDLVLDTNPLNEEEVKERVFVALKKCFS
jgi:cytidylate kinase